MNSELIGIQCYNAFYDAAIDIGIDLGGYSVLDLCADKLTDYSLAELKAAIKASKISTIASERIRQQIAAY